jgi:hypothetical protein
MALRIFPSFELDALIARELLVLRHEVPQFTRNFVPLCIGVTAFEETAGGAPGEVGSMPQLVRLPTSALLTALTASLRAVQNAVRRQRELQADVVAASVFGPATLLSSLAKAGALALRWQLFRSAYGRYLLHGQKRRNLVSDYLAHLTRFMITADSALLDTSLLAARLPDVFAASTPLGERAGQLGLPVQETLGELRAALARTPERDELLTSLEEQLTATENEYFHEPGQRMVLNTQEALPAELAAV